MQNNAGTNTPKTGLAGTNPVQPDDVCAGSVPGSPKTAHRRAIKTFGHALTLDSEYGWAGLATVLAARLSADELASLAQAVQAALGGAGVPGAPFISDMDEAGFWADLAARDELKAYALASYNRLAPADQSAFLNYVKGRAA